jgi:integrase
MSAKTGFSSSLSEAMNDFVAFKRMQGYDYTNVEKHLELFDRFLVEQGVADKWLRPELLSAYTAATASLRAGTREARLSAVRQFSRHLHARCPQSAVLPLRITPRTSPASRFYPFELEQICLLMDKAAQLRPKKGIRPGCIRFLIGFLYATGLRIGEALNLNLADVNMDDATVFVRKGKFGKDRIVAMTETTRAAVVDWLDLRSRYAASGPAAPFLVGRLNRRLTYAQARYAFGLLCRLCDIGGDPVPRLHDLRHNFASHCLARWRTEGKDIQALLPVLANAMGHVTIFDTQLYIHARAEDLQQASDKFRKHLTAQQEQSR